jgi:hypothetical protein
MSQDSKLRLSWRELSDGIRTFTYLFAAMAVIDPA